MLKKGHGYQGPYIVMLLGQSHKSHYEIDFTRKSKFLSFMDAFISYSHKNGAITEDLERELKANGLQVWIDTSGIRAGALLGPQLLDNIRAARVFLLLWSKSAELSPWVNTEWLAAFHLDTFIIPCVLDGTDLPYCLQKVLFVSLPRVDLELVQELVREIENAPASANHLALSPRYAPPELYELIRSISWSQYEVLKQLGRRDLKVDDKLGEAEKSQRKVDKLMREAENSWPDDIMTVLLGGYHLKNAYQVKYYKAIQAGRPPKDRLIEKSQQRFFEAVSINPTEHRALNGLGNYLNFIREHEAAEFFTLRAIAYAEQEGAEDNVRAYKRDLQLIRRAKEAQPRPLGM